MKPTKSLAIALCAVACASTIIFADDDFGIESASPTIIVNPVNPQPGMISYAYFPDEWMGWDELGESVSKLPTTAAAITRIDKAENFVLDQMVNGKARIGRWEGFIRCKRATKYTFVLSKDDGCGCCCCGFSFAVNGKILVPKGSLKASCDVDLKVGWNKIDIVCQYDNRKPLTVTFKPKGSTSEPRPIGPKDLFHDEIPEEAW